MCICCSPWSQSPSGVPGLRRKGMRTPRHPSHPLELASPTPCLRTRICSVTTSAWPTVTMTGESKSWEPMFSPWSFWQPTFFRSQTREKLRFWLYKVHHIILQHYYVHNTWRLCLFSLSQAVINPQTFICFYMIITRLFLISGLIEAPTKKTQC